MIVAKENRDMQVTFSHIIVLKAQVSVLHTCLRTEGERERTGGHHGVGMEGGGQDRVGVVKGALLLSGGRTEGEGPYGYL